MDRRKFLQMTASSTAAALFGLTVTDSAFAAALELSDGEFPYGVASGDPLPNGIMLWTRWTPDPAAVPGGEQGSDQTVEWVVATDEALAQIVRHGRARTGPDVDYTVKVDVRGLQPDQRYFYGFKRGPERSPVGRFTTAPRNGSSPGNLRFGHVSCSNYAAGYFGAYRYLSDRDDLDFVLHCGDYIYEYGDAEYGGFRPLDPAEEIVSLSDYRRRYGLYRTDPDLQRLHRKHAMVSTIDDHEITNNAWRDGAQNHDDSEGDYRQRAHRALQAYFEWMPVRPERSGLLYRTLRFGDLAELSMLDLRRYRDEQAATWTETDNPDRTMLGDRQYRWLRSQVAGRAPRWRLFGNSVQMMPVDYPDGLFVSTGNGTSRNVDAWDGYRAERSKVLSLLGEQGDRFDPVFLTGDIHSTWAADLLVGEGAAATPVGTEFVCTSVTSDNLNEILGVPPRSEVTIGLERAIAALNPHVSLLELDSHGCSIIDVTAERVRSDWFYLSDREDPDASVSFATARQTIHGTKAVDSAIPTSAL